MKLIICSLLLYSCSVFSQWVKLNPVSSNPNCSKCDFIDQNTGWIAGDSGCVLYTSNGGVSWANRNTPDENLIWIQFINANTGFTSGSSSSLYKTTNGGLNWITLVTDPGAINHAFHFFDQVNGILCGGNILLKTTNGGNNWYTLLNGGYFINIFFLNAQTGWVSTLDGNIFKTTNAGNNWTSMYGIGGKLYFINELTGWVVTPYIFSSVYKTTNGGYNWILQQVPYNIKRAVAFLDENTGFVSGTGIFKTTNGGANWTNFDYYYTSEVTDLAVLNNNTVIGVGERSAICLTTNKGTNWTNISRDIGSDIRNIKFFNQSTGYISGYFGLLAKSTDGGVSWNKKFVGSLQNQSVFFLDHNNWWRLTEKKEFFRTSNGGESWLVLNFPITRSIYGISFTDVNNGWLNADSGLIAKTTNGGVSWNVGNLGTDRAIVKVLEISSNRILAFSFNAQVFLSTNSGGIWSSSFLPGESIIADACVSDPNTVYINGSQKFFRSTDAGSTWQAVFEGLPYQPSRIVYTQGTLYTVYESSVYKSENGGYNWSGSGLSVPVGAFLNSISSTDRNTCWVVGDRGMIFRNLNSSTIGIDPSQNELPENFVLHQNYPNPFNPATRISYEIPKFGFVEISIYDITGKKVADLVNQVLNPGKYTADFDGSHLSSGVYFYRLQAGEKLLFRKMILLK